MRTALALALVSSLGCKEPTPKMTMAPEDVIEAIEDFAERGCACETDKECSREVRDEWDAVKRDLVKNAHLMTGEERKAYEVERLRFGHCGDGAPSRDTLGLRSARARFARTRGDLPPSGAGLAVFDKW